MFLLEVYTFAFIRSPPGRHCSFYFRILFVKWVAMAWDCTLSEAFEEAKAERPVAAEGWSRMDRNEGESEGRTCRDFPI